MATKRLGRIRTRQQRLPLDQPELELGDLSAEFDEPENLAEITDETAGTDAAIIVPEIAAELEEPEAAAPEMTTAAEAPEAPAVAAEVIPAATAATDNGDHEPPRLKIIPAAAALANADPAEVPAPAAVEAPAVAEAAETPAELATPARSRPASRRMKRVPTPKPFVARATQPPPAAAEAVAAGAPIPEPEIMEKNVSPKKPAAAIPAAAEPGSLGDSLRQAREAAGYSIPQVAELCHIRMDYVKALETDDLSRLPAASIYTKSYIKSLCRQYKIDAEPLLARFENRPGRPAPAAAGAKAAEPVEDFRPAENTNLDVNLEAPVAGISGRHLAWAAAAALAIVAMVLVIGMGKRLISARSVETVASITSEEIAQLIPSPVLRMRELSIPESR